MASPIQFFLTILWSTYRTSGCALLGLLLNFGVYLIRGSRDERFSIFVFVFYFCLVSRGTWSII